MVAKRGFAIPTLWRVGIALFFCALWPVGRAGARHPRSGSRPGAGQGRMRRHGLIPVLDDPEP